MIVLQLENGIKFLDKSLTEHRTPDISKLKQQVCHCHRYISHSIMCCAD